MRTKFFLFILLCSHFIAKAQDTIYQTLTPEQGIQLIVADQIGRAFIAKNNRLWCFSDNGTLQWCWQNPLLSSITHVDTNNPLKILLFYRDENSIEILDKNGKLINSINLNTWGYSDIISVSAAADNSLWMFDQQQKILLNVSADGTLLSKSIDISLLSNKNTINPIITISNTSIYLCINDSEIISFDTQSSFKKRLIIPANHSMINITNNDDIYYREANKIIVQSLIKQLESSTIIDSIKPSNPVYFTEFMYLIDSNRIVKQKIRTNR